MRLVNSVCKVIADTFSGIPVYIEEVPNEFERPSFFVTKVTDPKELKNINIYQNNPTFQIVYFGERSEANQVLAEPLYGVEDKLEEIFLLALAMPVIEKDETEKKHRRYAKIESFTSQLRLDEGALYCNLSLDFTENIPKQDEHEIIEQVDLSISRETM